MPAGRRACFSTWAVRSSSSGSTDRGACWRPAKAFGGRTVVSEERGACTGRSTWRGSMLEAVVRRGRNGQQRNRSRRRPARRGFSRGGHGSQGSASAGMDARGTHEGDTSGGVHVQEVHGAFALFGGLHARGFIDRDAATILTTARSPCRSMGIVGGAVEAKHRRRSGQTHRLRCSCATYFQTEGEVFRPASAPRSAKLQHHFEKLAGKVRAIPCPRLEARRRPPRGRATCSKKSSAGETFTVGDQAAESLAQQLAGVTTLDGAARGI